MLLNTDILRELLVRELLWDVGTKDRAPTNEQRQAAERRAEAFITRYTRRLKEAAYKDVGNIFKDDRGRGR